MKLEVSCWGCAPMAKKCRKKRDCCFANLNLLLFCHSRCCCHRHCFSSLLLWSKNFASMVTWRYTALLYNVWVLFILLTQLLLLTICFFRKGWPKGQNWGPEESYSADFKWRENAIIADGNHQVSHASWWSYHQEAAVDILGDCPQDWARWKTAARDDSCLWCLQKGKRFKVRFVLSVEFLQSRKLIIILLLTKCLTK